MGPRRLMCVICHGCGSQKGVALGLSTLRLLRQDLAVQGTTSKTEPKGYTKDDVAALMGFLGINDGQTLQPIWDLFSTTRGKNIEVYWHHIVSCINKWSFDWQVSIDTSIYLEQEMIKAIIDLCFNLGKGVAHLEASSKGLSILACPSCTSPETVCICKHEYTLLTMGRHANWTSC